MENNAMAGQIKLTISIENGAVVVTAGDGSKGGNVRARSLRRIVWERETGGANKVDSFDLKFERLDGVVGALASAADLPLLEIKAQPGNVTIDEDAGTISGAHRVGARLAEVGIYKYSVTAKQGPTTLTLDPIIIIEE